MKKYKEKARHKVLANVGRDGKEGTVEGLKRVIGEYIGWGG